MLSQYRSLQKRTDRRTNKLNCLLKIPEEENIRRRNFNNKNCRLKRKLNRLKLRLKKPNKNLEMPTNCLLYFYADMSEEENIRRRNFNNKKQQIKEKAKQTKVETEEAKEDYRDAVKLLAVILCR